MAVSFSSGSVGALLDGIVSRTSPMFGNTRREYSQSGSFAR
jgi:hypothetical protein